MRPTTLSTTTARSMAALCILAACVASAGSARPIPPGTGGYERFFEDLQAGSSYPRDLPARLTEKALSYLRKGLAMDYYRVPPESRQCPFPTTLYSTIQQLARLATDAGFVRECQNRPEDAVNWYLHCILFGQQIRSNSQEFGALIATAIQDMGIVSLEALLANTRLPEHLRAMPLTPHQLYTAGLSRATYQEAKLRALAIRAGINLYVAEHATPPSELSQLSPAYLPSIPVDPFSGKPYRDLRQHGTSRAAEESSRSGGHPRVRSRRSGCSD